MKSAIRGDSKKSPVSDRIDLRIDPNLKKDLLKFCESYQETTSDCTRRAIEQYITWGSFKNKLLEYLHKNAESRKKFMVFFESCPLTIKDWFESLLGPEEKSLIENTPPVLFNSISKFLITEFGRKALELKLLNVSRKNVQG